MTNYVPLRYSVHGQAGFRRAQDVQHARREALAPVLLDELLQVASRMPLCFVSSTRDGAGAFRLVALLGVVKDTNLFVHPHTHQWIGGYVPACYRSYPFGLLDSGGKRVLAVDADSGLLEEPPSAAAVPLFDESGNPSEPVRESLAFLDAVEQSQATTQVAVDALGRAGVVEPWPLQIAFGEREVPLRGLYRIDQAALAALDGETVATLHGLGALQVAYAQLFSAPLTRRLGKLQELHEKARTKAFDVEELFGKDDGVEFDFSL